MEEVLVLRRGSGDGDRRWDSDTRDQDPVDGTTELINHHRGSVDKLRSHTLGYQVGETEQRHEGGGSFLFWHDLWRTMSQVRCLNKHIVEVFYMSVTMLLHCKFHTGVATSICCL